MLKSMAENGLDSSGLECGEVGPVVNMVMGLWITLNARNFLAG
jgi:hypothetical protein